MKIYFVAKVDSYYDIDGSGHPDPLGKIVTEETPLIDKGIFANAAKPVVLVGDLLREKKAEWERDGYDPVIVGNWVYQKREDMELYPACFTAFTVREREVIGS